MRKSDKKITIGLSQQDFDELTVAADEDFRTTAQYVSILVSRSLAASRKSNVENIGKAKAG